MKQTIETTKCLRSPVAGIQFNSLETYRDAGQKAGLAQHRKDYRLRSFHCNWLTRALALESQPYRDTAHAAFDKAYCIETGVIKHI